MRSSIVRRSLRLGVRVGLAACFGFAVTAVAPAVHADPSSWFSLAGGAGLWTENGTRRTPGALQLELGLGSSPASPVVVGGVFKALMFVGRGTDLALTLRTATGGFVRGDFGVAVDIGGYERFWEVGSQGFLGAVVLGAPYGLQLTAMTEQGTNDLRAYTAVLGIDFLRLTVYRDVSGGYWPNPMRAPVEARR
ncbi:MAG: hypothetical protein ABW133_04305 [Polyangiaceae bacterium]